MLVDATASAFATTQVGCIVENTTTDRTGYVTSVDSDNQLTLSENVCDKFE